MWTGFQGERVASLHARSGTSNVSRALVIWKRLNCCLRNSWDTPTILGFTRNKLVQAGNILGTFTRPLPIYPAPALQRIWIESFLVRTAQCGASVKLKSGFSELRQFLHRPEQIANLGQDGVFENWLVGYKRVSGGNALHWRIQMMEELVSDARRNLGAVSPAEGIFIGNQRTIGFLHRRGDCVPVKRTQSAKVNQFDTDLVFALQFLRRL